MTLDKRYVVAYHTLSPMFAGIHLPSLSGPMDSATTGFNGPLLFSHLLSTTNTWSLTCRPSWTPLQANDIESSCGDSRLLTVTTRIFR